MSNQTFEGQRIEHIRMFDSVTKGRPRAFSAVRRLAEQHEVSYFIVMRTCAEHQLDPLDDTDKLHRALRETAEANEQGRAEAVARCRDQVAAKGVES